MVSLDKLTTRIHIFRHLSIDEIDNSINMKIFENLLNEYYDTFISFCNTIRQANRNVDTISCYLEEGELKFELKYKDDSSEKNETIKID